MYQLCPLGTPKEKIQTPALIIDADILEENIKYMSEFFKNKNASLRPHVKTHKCPTIAHMQIQAGAIGMCCAKISEAEVLAASGVQSILIANEIVGTGKVFRAAALARHVEIIVAVDNMGNIDELAKAAEYFESTINIVIEVNVGNMRCGIRTEKELLKHAAKIASYKHLHLRGVMGYEGHCVFIKDKDERNVACSKANEILLANAGSLKANGYEIDIVSAGGTGTYDLTGSYPGVTEVEAGSYVFMDKRYGDIHGDTFRQSLSILATVISRPEKNVAFTDVGMKSVTHEFGMPAVNAHGMELTKLSEEHGKIELSDEAVDLKVGDVIDIVPSHCCTTVNLYNVFYVVRKGKLEAIWDISCRGMNQ